MVKCPENLPDAKDGSRIEIQRNRKEHQQIYHDCGSRHNNLVDSLTRQGIKGQ